MMQGFLDWVSLPLRTAEAVVAGRQNFPANYVSWFDAVRFANLDESMVNVGYIAAAAESAR